MASVNKVILVGNLGRDPEIRYLPSGDPVANITIATSSKYKGKDGNMVEETEWHRITCFNGLGKTVQQYCDTGMKVLVRGRIHYTKWKDAEGNDRYGCEIIAETVDFLSRAKQTENDDGKFIDDDDIPF